MSVVTNVLLKLPICEEEKIHEINKFFGERRGFEEEIGANCGGTKVMEATVFPAAFNHLEIEKFIEHIRSIEWESPESVQLFICGQEEELFTERFHE
jgi:hypothetical protein